jgi:hypothetical protein
MPIVEPAPWRHQYFADVPCPDEVFIPTDDPEAWAWNPKHRWVFDKLQVALSQGLEAAPHGLEPAAYPVFSKPVFNFGGLGAGSRVLRSRDDYVRHNTPGHMWMPLCEGRHVSTDAAVIAGKVHWFRHATGLPTAAGMFDYWTVHAAPDAALEQRLEAWIARHLDGYTGMLNIETIGGTIIEVHLRFADQWPDLYGNGWVEALVALYRDKRWRFEERGRHDGYSIALFGPHGRRYRHPPRDVIDSVVRMPGVSSVQITFHENRPSEQHSMPPGGFRVALVNAWDLEQGKAARERLAEWFGVRGQTQRV